MDRLRLLVEKSTLEMSRPRREFEIAAYTRQVKENEYQTEQEECQTPQDHLTPEWHGSGGQPPSG